MEIVSLIISILAILGSLYVYFSHDRKLKKQESKLNELQLSEIKESKEDRMKAIVRMDTSYSSKGMVFFIYLMRVKQKQEIFHGYLTTTF